MLGCTIGVHARPTSVYGMQIYQPSCFGIMPQILTFLVLLKWILALSSKSETILWQKTSLPVSASDWPWPADHVGSRFTLHLEIWLTAPKIRRSFAVTFITDPNVYSHQWILKIMYAPFTSNFSTFLRLVN